MCRNKSGNASSFALNPCAKEWRPAPAHMPVQLVPYFSAPLYFQGFIPYGHCTRQLPNYRSVFFPLPTIGRLNGAAPPASGGHEGKYEASLNEEGWGRDNNKVESAIIKIRRRNQAGVGVKAPRRQQEWRAKNVLGGTRPAPPLKLSASSTKGSSCSRTTVMIRNIPNKLRRDFMLEFMDDYCKTYSLEYDFFYLPMDFCKEDNLGYAFVNFTSTGAALKFKKVLQNYKWGTLELERGTLTSKKVCEITWAAIQGKKQLLGRFQNSIFLCNKLDFLPVLLDPPRNGLNSEIAPPVVVGSLRQR